MTAEPQPLPQNPAEEPDSGPVPLSSGIKPLLIFTAIALTCLAVCCFTPLREEFTVDRISDLARRLGVWGPVVLTGIGIVSPLLFLPRWPVAFVGGILYGIVWGSVLANCASTVGALLHFWMAKGLLGPTSERLLQRSRIRPGAIPREKAFIALFLLRAFPLSSFVVTNLLAGALKVQPWTYLTSSFLGMIPSTIMYAAWGKLLKKPSAGTYITAVALLVLLLAGTWFARKHFGAWIRSPKAPEAGKSPAGADRARP